MSRVFNWDPETEVWELYNLTDDYAQSQDLANENPGKLAEMKALFDKEATDNSVYPIGGSMYTVFFSPSELRSTLAVIDANIGANAEGVLFAVGGISVGFTVYMDNGYLRAEYNAMTLKRYKITSDAPIPTGKVRIEVETSYDAKERMAPATVTFTVNGIQVGQGRVE